jgi:hypothetical protein
MSNPITILLKRSNVAGQIPALSALEYGELAINTTDGKIFTKATNNSLITFQSPDPASTIVSSQSASWNSVYSTVQSNSASNWNYQGTDLKNLSANWQNTYSTVQSNSASNWSYQGTDLKNLSANWENTYSTVQTNSASNWNYQGTDLKSLSANWQNTYTTVQDNSASNWSYQGTDLKNLSANWENTYSTVQTNSASNWSYQGTDLKSLSANWENTYTTVGSGSASWSTAYQYATAYNLSAANYNSSVEWVLAHPKYFEETFSNTATNSAVTVVGLVPYDSLVAQTSSVQILSASGSNSITLSGHGLVARTPFRFTNIVGASASPQLSANVDYYVSSVVNANSFRFAATAFGSAVSVTNSGTASVIISNADAVLAATGNGSLLAQVPNNTAARGNKRGPFATDWQRVRLVSCQVASGSYSVINGGSSNTASGCYSTVAGGYSNSGAGAFGVISGGSGNSASCAHGTIAGGCSNSVTGTFGAIGGGRLNSVSGTHGTIGGGSSNSASGSYSTIGGGYSNYALASYSSVGGGISNRASGCFSTVGGGYNNCATGCFSEIGGGCSNCATGCFSRVGGGNNNCATGVYSVVEGGYGAVADRYGLEAKSSGYYSNCIGSIQKIQATLFGKTEFGSASVLSLDGQGSFPYFTAQDKKSLVTIQVLGVDEVGNSSHLVRRVAINNANNIDQILQSEIIGTDDTSAGSVSFTIDNSNRFVLSAQGLQDNYVWWNAAVYGVEVKTPPAPYTTLTAYPDCSNFDNNTNPFVLYITPSDYSTFYINKARTEPYTSNFVISETNSGVERSVEYFLLSSGSLAPTEPNPQACAISIFLYESSECSTGTQWPGLYRSSRLENGCVIYTDSSIPTNGSARFSGNNGFYNDGTYRFTVNFDGVISNIGPCSVSIDIWLGEECTSPNPPDVTVYSDSGTIVEGLIVYSDVDRTSPFPGGNAFYNDNNSNVFTINDQGVVSSLSSCP